MTGTLRFTFEFYATWLKHLALHIWNVCMFCLFVRCYMHTLQKALLSSQTQYLFKRGPHGWDTWLYTQVLLAFEQDNYCDFEIQLEIAHNAIHSWIGGRKERSLAHLHYASYDPLFYIHHSNTDRLFALWQALQRYRGYNPNEANCAVEQQSVSIVFFFYFSYNISIFL